MNSGADSVFGRDTGKGGQRYVHRCTPLITAAGQLAPPGNWRGFSYRLYERFIWNAGYDRRNIATIAPALSIPARGSIMKPAASLCMLVALLVAASACTDDDFANAPPMMWADASSATITPNGPVSGSSSGTITPTRSAPGGSGTITPNGPGSGDSATGVTATTNNPAPGQSSPGGMYCREFEETITIDGQPQRAHGRACRQPDGTWKIR